MMLSQQRGAQRLFHGALSCSSHTQPFILRNGRRRFVAPSTQRVDVMGSPEALWSELTTLFNRQGDVVYDDSVTQRQHALQCATLALDARSDASLITASLLHDIGHMLLDDSRERCAIDRDDEDSGHSVNLGHETIASNWLARNFARAVTEPVRLHVAAKRYLCFSEPTYAEKLSSASRSSLEIQGGAFTKAEADEFLLLPESRDAVAVRRFNDMARKVGDDVHPLEAFKEFVMSAYAQSDAAS